MSEHDLEKLLGGFAADTLTPEEKQELYTAALQDQQLFNALADEQALKELLADPDVRRRLLASLEQKSISDAGGALSWLDWFRRPSGLALAGGLTAAALAVVLGVRIYQDSLRQAARSVATEEVKQTTPQAIEPQAKTKENLAPAIDFEKEDRLVDKPAKREQSAPPPPKTDRASDVARESKKQRSEQDEVRTEARAPVTAPGKSVDKITLSADQKLEAGSTPPPSAPEPKQKQTPAGGQIAGAVTPTASARALFYGGEQPQPNARLMAKEQEQAMKPLAESAPQTNRPEPPLEGRSQPGRTASTAVQPRPLGLRYSFVIRGTDGRQGETDAATASKNLQPAILIVEANQEAYLQVWMKVDSSTPQLLWPEKESGQVSRKIPAGQRIQISLQMEREPITLTVRLSLMPPGPITKDRSAIFDRLSPNQLEESVTESTRTGSQERATYVVNQDSSTSAQIVVDMTVH